MLRIAVALSIGLASSIGSDALAQEAGSFRPAPGLQLPSLQDTVRAASPDVAQALLALDLARSSLWQARLPQNPAIDFTWGAVPVGDTNPANLPDPLGNVPNYSIGLTIPISSFWKLPSKIDQAGSALEGARAELEGTTREKGLALARALGGVAAAQLRIESTKALVAESQKAVKVAEERLAQKFGTELEVERLRIEAERNVQQMHAAKANLAVALATCAGLAGKACEPFGSVEEARKYVEKWTDDAEKQVRSIEERPDLVALKAYAKAASAEVQIAKLQRIPDVTFRIGYVHDRFYVSGAQMNSINLSLSVTLPIFDWGQAQYAAAVARERRLAEARDKAIAAAKAMLPPLRTALEEQKLRRDALVKGLLPRARSVVADLERAAEARLVTLLDVIQARRTLSELGLDEADSLGESMNVAVDIETQAPIKKKEKGTDK